MLDSSIAKYGKKERDKMLEVEKGHFTFQQQGDESSDTLGVSEQNRKRIFMTSRFHTICLTDHTGKKPKKKSISTTTEILAKLVIREVVQRHNQEFVKEYIKKRDAYELASKKLKSTLLDEEVKKEDRGVHSVNMNMSASQLSSQRFWLNEQSGLITRPKRYYDFLRSRTRLSPSQRTKINTIRRSIQNSQIVDLSAPKEAIPFYERIEQVKKVQRQLKSEKDKKKVVPEVEQEPDGYNEFMKHNPKFGDWVQDNFKSRTFNPVCVNGGIVGDLYNDPDTGRICVDRVFYFRLYDLLVIPPGNIYCISNVSCYDLVFDFTSVAKKKDAKRIDREIREKRLDWISQKYHELHAKKKSFEELETKKQAGLLSKDEWMKLGSLTESERKLYKKLSLYIRFKPKKKFEF